MKNAENIMFRIGKIVNIVLIPLSAILMVIGLIALIVGGVALDTAIAAGDAQAQIDAQVTIASGSSCLVWGIYTLIFSIVSLVVCKNKRREIENGSDEVAPRVFLIVFGAIGENPFYVLSGIFSLVARNQEHQNPPAQSE